MATTEVILREKITGLGVEADVVKVKAGFARHHLIPTGKAYEATKGNLRNLESLQAKRTQREAEELANAQELVGKISRLRPKFTLETGQGGKAFGSITSMDIHKELESRISQFLSTEDTILYGSCFDANTGLFETLLSDEDAIISDELNHASIIDCIRLCRADRKRYIHSAMTDIEDKLKETSSARFRMIATDGVFRMQCDVSKLV